MRIVIAGAQKSGNVWLKCLLAHTYGLRVLLREEAPARATPDAFRDWVAAGGFPDGTVFHLHFNYSDALADAIDAVPAQIVTIVRDPYDAFVSYYHAVQRRKDRGLQRDLLIGNPLNHPDVLTYLRKGGYRNQLRLARGWMASGRATVVRYEDMHRDPIATLAQLGERLGLAEEGALEGAVRSCSAENMQSLEFVRPLHVRTARVGDSRDHLTEAHLEIIRERYGELIRSLGYPVR